MYKLYNTRIKLTSSYITPWQSDTIIGHIFWSIKYRFGEERLNEIISSAKDGKPLFIVSDALPVNNFPKFNIDFDFGKLGIDDAKDYSKFKNIKKKKNVDLEQFNRFIQGESIEKYYRDELKNKGTETIGSGVLGVSVTHNSINRLSGTTDGEGGQVFNIEEYFTGSAKVKNSDDSIFDIFFKIREGYDISELKIVLEDMARNGYGKKNSIGKGSFKIVKEISEYSSFVKVKEPNAYIVLSNYIPKKLDYDEVITAETITKYGKLGGDYALSDMPFKKPFICFARGSIFKSDSFGVKGKILEELHHDKRIVQFGIPFVLEVKIDE